MYLRIPELVIPVRVGVYDWEKTAPRDVALMLAAAYGAPDAAQSDLLADTVDYAALEECAVQAAQARHYELLESLIGAVAKAVMAAFPQIFELTVEASKAGALKHAKTVVVGEVFFR
jgi:dihydroneopterin aldolase